VVVVDGNVVEVEVVEGAGAGTVGAGSAAVVVVVGGGPAMDDVGVTLTGVVAGDAPAVCPVLAATDTAAKTVNVKARRAAPRRIRRPQRARLTPGEKCTMSELSAPEAPSLAFFYR
jgi:hypothetical protein